MGRGMDIRAWTREGGILFCWAGLLGILHNRGCYECSRRCLGISGLYHIPVVRFRMTRHVSLFTALVVGHYERQEGCRLEYQYRHDPPHLSLTVAFLEANRRSRG
jgi:hypothetical protein